MIGRFAGARASVAHCVARSSAVLALAVALVVVSGGVAHADGDPASDYLVANQVFLTSQSTGMSPAQRQLVATVAAANRAGFAIRVAVISSDYDLGSVTELWDQPRTYARFLGVELSFAYRRQRLLVVMPNGFGFNWPGHATAGTYRLLATVPLDSSAGTGLAGAAEVAVRRLARASGVALPPSQPAAGGGPARPGSAGTLTIIGAVAGGIAALFAFAVVVTRARRRLAHCGGNGGRSRGVPGCRESCGGLFPGWRCCVGLRSPCRSLQRAAPAAAALRPPTRLCRWSRLRRPAGVPAIVALPISHSVTRTADLYRSQRTEDGR